MRDVQELRSDERWAAAFEMAHLIMQEDERRSRSWRQFWQRTGVHVVFWAVAGPGVLYLLWLVGMFPDVDLTRLTPVQLVAVGFVLLAIVINAFGIELAIYTRRKVGQRGSVIDPLNREERKVAKSQVAGTAEVDEAKLPVLITLARENQRASRVALTQGAAALLAFVGIALGALEPSIALLALALFAGVVAVLVVSATGFRRANRFLTRYGGSDGDWLV